MTWQLAGQDEREISFLASDEPRPSALHFAYEMLCIERQVKPSLAVHAHPGEIGDEY